MQTWKMTIEK